MKILHVDLDAFYASVEELDHPEYRNKPMAVGGQRDDGILTTANYAARAYGVHSAMPVFMAKSLCPQLKVLPLHRKKYLEKSREVFGVLRTFSPLVEQVSIDEAYLAIDHRPGDYEKRALALKKAVKDKTGLTLSVGLSYNKFLAKLASDWNKPDGFFMISPQDIPDLLLPLKVEKVHGVGQKSAEKLKALGIYTVQDLYQLDRAFLYQHFNKAGIQWYDRIRGIDQREVTPASKRKSLGTETTLERASQDPELLWTYIQNLCRELEEDCLDKNIQGYTLTLKVKTGKFKTHTRSRTLGSPIYQAKDMLMVLEDLFQEVYQKKESYRLVGVTLSNLMDRSIRQLTFL